MRLFTTSVIAAILAMATASFAQPPKGKAPDDPSPPADPPRFQPPSDAPRPRREPRADDDGPPPPGKARRGDSPSYQQPAPMPVPGMPGPGGFGGGMRAGGPGMGGYGGGGARYGAFGPGGMMPGMPGPANAFGEPPPDDPEMRELIKQDTELEHQSMQLAHRVRDASGDERQKLRESLADTVSKHFEVRQKRRELQIKRMEDELKRLRDEITKRNDARKSIIDNRLREMTGDPRELDF